MNKVLGNKIKMNQTNTQPREKTDQKLFEAGTTFLEINILGVTVSTLNAAFEQSEKVMPY